MSEEYSLAATAAKEALQNQENLTKAFNNYIKVTEAIMKDYEKTIAAQAKENEALKKKIEKIQKIFGE